MRGLVITSTTTQVGFTVLQATGTGSSAGAQPRWVAFISRVVPAGRATSPCQGCQIAGTPLARLTVAATSSPCSCRRVTRVRWAAPAQASSTAMARPAPPAPSITTRWPASGATLAIAFTTPLPSLLWPIRRPFSIVR